ncbi:type IV toxin-antitoxin system AbiEi family antitoxin domain-containing protein [Antribacter gilvus]|uniref:type IV toxin-antitoxin system AbiEi family antitoxin domain-containing protein n=1 Tax=Antribacter gilvus TaxID=2304675 RepID=UPI000F789E60|nr:type IV toxin-antitoxin system AbiEi family antitoxin domain-containing protein [Antribacter gilvus]
MRTPRPVPPSLLELARRQGGLVSVAQCDASGVTRHQRTTLIRSAVWGRPTRGVYDTRVTAPGMHTNDVSRLRCAHLGLLAYPGSAAVGVAALVLAGVKGLPARFRPEVAMPRAAKARSRDGITVRQYDFQMETVPAGGRRAAALAWAFAQAIPRLSRNTAVAALDSALHQGLLDAAGLTRVRALLTGRRRSARCHCWIDLTDGRAESPNESHARLLCEDAGIAPDDVQRVLSDSRGRFLGRADLAWHLGGGRWLVVEIDSQQFHTSERDVRSDAYRQNGLLSGGGHQVLRYFPEHLREPDYVVGEIREVLQQAGWRPGQVLPPPTR